MDQQIVRCVHSLPFPQRKLHRFGQFRRCPLHFTHPEQAANGGRGRVACARFAGMVIAGTPNGNRLNPRAERMNCAQIFARENEIRAVEQFKIQIQVFGDRFSLRACVGFALGKSAANGV